MADYRRLPDDGEHEIWACGECGEKYEYEDTARYCCSSYDQVWLCFDCGAHYEDQDDAARCCGHTPEFHQYQCVVDEYQYETEDEAMQCCSPHGGELVEDDDQEEPECAPKTPDEMLTEALEDIAAPNNWEEELA